MPFGNVLVAARVNAFGEVSLFSGNDEERLKKMVMILCLVWSLVSIYSPRLIPLF